MAGQHLTGWGLPNEATRASPTAGRDPWRSDLRQSVGSLEPVNCLIPCCTRILRNRWSVLSSLR